MLIIIFNICDRHVGQDFCSCYLALNKVMNLILIFIKLAHVQSKCHTALVILGKYIVKKKYSVRNYNTLFEVFLEQNNFILFTIFLLEKGEQSFLSYKN